MTKVITASKTSEGSIQLPPEALAVLGDSEQLFLVIDQEAGLVTISAKDPELRENEEIMRRIAELNAGVSDEDYFAPVPDSFLKAGKTDKNKEGGGE